MKKTIYNAVVFNVAWLVCVLGGSMIAVPTAIVVIGVHLYFFSDNNQEILLILAVVLLGVVVDSVFLRTGFLIAPDNSLWSPWWLISLWALFATTLNHSLSWFHTRLPVAVLVGGIAGMMTYLAGTRLTDYSLKLPLLNTMVVMLITWCIVFPVCLVVCRKLLGSERV